MSRPPSIGETPHPACVESHKPDEIRPAAKMPGTPNGLVPAGGAARGLLKGWRAVAAPTLDSADEAAATAILAYLIL